MATLEPDVADFLMTGTRTGMLGFLAADGRPLVAPVWFVVDGNDLVFNTDAASAKARAFARDPRVVLCVDDPHPPFSFVQVQGTVTLSDDLKEVQSVARRAGGRYMGADRAEEFGRRNGVPGELAVRLHPSKVIKAFRVAT